MPHLRKNENQAEENKTQKISFTEDNFPSLGLGAEKESDKNNQPNQPSIGVWGTKKLTEILKEEQKDDTIQEEQMNSSENNTIKIEIIKTRSDSRESATETNVIRETSVSDDWTNTDWSFNDISLNLN